MHVFILVYIGLSMVCPCITCHMHGYNISQLIREHSLKPCPNKTHIIQMMLIASKLKLSALGQLDTSIPEALLFGHGVLALFERKANT